MTGDDQLTIRDEHGASLILERDNNGRPSAWIAPPGGNDGHSVDLDETAVATLGAFLGLPSVPVVDYDGTAVWLDLDGTVQFWAVGAPVPAGWRRLYVQADGGAA